MVTPSESAADARPLEERTCTLSPEAEEELRRAIDEIERGDYIELTPEQLDRWAERGERPWPEESLG